jgi:hypothetical protein
MMIEAAWRGRPALASRGHLGLALPNDSSAVAPDVQGLDALATPRRQGQDALATATALQRHCWDCHQGIHGKARSLSASPTALRPGLPDAGLEWIKKGDKE